MPSALPFNSQRTSFTFRIRFASSYELTKSTTTLRFPWTEGWKKSMCGARWALLYPNTFSGLLTFPSMRSFHWFVIECSLESHESLENATICFSRALGQGAADTFIVQPSRFLSTFYVLETGVILKWLTEAGLLQLEQVWFAYTSVWS